MLQVLFIAACLVAILTLAGTLALTPAVIVFGGAAVTLLIVWVGLFA